MKNENPSIEHIDKIRIPDSDMPGWLEVLRQPDSNGNMLADEEIDQVLAQLNTTYADAKGIINIDEELARLEKYLREEHGRELTDEQRQYLRKGIESRNQ